MISCHLYSVCFQKSIVGNNSWESRKKILLHAPTKIMEVDEGKNIWGIAESAGAVEYTDCFFAEK